MNNTFEMVAKTFQGLEDILAEELRNLGAADISTGKRMVSFRGDLEMMYRANMCCRTALRILKPFARFTAHNADELYYHVKEIDWSSLMNVEQTFSIDTVAFSDEFRHSQFVTYRVKDGIADWFRDHFGEGKRPRVRLEGADIIFNVHIAGKEVILSLDSSGESLHRRGYRKAQTEAPINEVLAAGIILKSGWKGEKPFVDPMCGSGTFLIEAALIAGGIAPGIFRKHYSFENWKDFDADLMAKIYNDDSLERPIECAIIGADISPRAIAIAKENAASAGIARYITFETRSISQWDEAPKPAGVLITNPPYGKRIGADDMHALYSSIGSKLKHTFTGYNAWIIGYTDEYFRDIALTPSQRISLNNGGLDCELREYVIFEGTRSKFRKEGGIVSHNKPTIRKEHKDFRENGRPQRKFEQKDSGERKGKSYDKKSKEERPNRFERDKQTERKERSPFDISKLGRQPRISVENEIVLRPAWRTRKHKDNDENQNNK